MKKNLDTSSSKNKENIKFTIALDDFFPYDILVHRKPT